MITLSAVKLNINTITSLLLMQAFDVHINTLFAYSWWFLYNIIN